MSGKHSEGKNKFLFGRQIPLVGPHLMISVPEIFSIYFLYPLGLAMEEEVPVLGEHKQLPCCCQDAAVEPRSPSRSRLLPNAHVTPVAAVLQKPAPGHAEVPPGAVMGGTWCIPGQVNMALFSQAGWRARSPSARACVCSLSCAKRPRPHGAGSSSGGLHQTKPLCSPPFSQLSAVLPESEPSGLSERSGFLCQGSPTAPNTTWLPPARFFSDPALSACHCTCSQHQGIAELRQEG